jgi:beta-galactosidase
MKYLRILIAMLVISATSVFAADDAPRERLLMDFGWQFHLGDAPDAGTQFDYPEFTRLDKTRPDDDQQEATNAPLRVDAAATNLGKDVSFVQPGFDVTNWRTLDLPHDWAVELPFDKKGDKAHGYKPLGLNFPANSIGWYRRTFELPATDKGRALWIEFDGAYRNCLVWLNGVCLGRNVSGYGSFYYDISRAANYGGTNTLVVRVDATRFEGWFYEGAGIYRHVWLVKTGAAHVAHWGTFVTSTVTNNDAEVSVETILRNDSAQPVSAKIVSKIVNAKGRKVAQSEPFNVTIGTNAEQILTQKVEVASAKLWSLKNPYLYKMISRVEVGGKLSDVYETPFGIRTIKWDANEGFQLNGKHVFLKGTANHQDAAGVGIAVPDALNVWRLEQLKKFGCNAYRTAHGPATPELLDACDRLGILVFTEQRRIGHTAQSLGDLENLVNRDRNHPSIIAWGLGNEELSAQGKDEAAKTLAVPNRDLVHRLDPTRPATFAMNWDWGNGFSKVLDVQGFNYWFQGTHSKNRGHFLDVDEFHAAFPNQPAFGSEEGSTSSTRGIYHNDKTNAYLSAYDRNLPRGGDAQREWGSTAEAWMNYYAARPWLAGAFVWTGFDYRGEPTPYAWPGIGSPTGIFDACGFPKDNFYYYQAWWTDKPVLHILPHWNWPGKEGQEIEVWVHSNFEAVELFLNGQSLGKKDMPRLSHLEWRVKYAPGKLEARGYKHGKVAATTFVETTGAPAKLVLTTDRKSINADGEDVAVINISAVDTQGRDVPTASNLVQFEITGGKIIGVGNGDSSCHESDQGRARSLFNGRAQVIAQTKIPGELKLVASAEGLQPATLTLPAKIVEMSSISRNPTATKLSL